MRDGDLAAFTEFAAARWPTWVRVVELLGVPPAAAPRVATEALAELRRRWHRLRVEDDPDVEALRLLLDGWRDFRRRPSPGASRLPGELAALDSLDFDARVSAVLSGLGVDDGVTARVLGSIPAERVSIAPDAWAGARVSRVSTPVPSAETLRQVIRRRRVRRTRHWSVPILVVLAAAAAVAGYRSARPSDDRPGRLPPAAASPAGSARDPGAWMTWYTGVELHLGPTVVRITGIAELAATHDGAVYVDADDRVVRVTPSGERTLLGAAEPDSLVGSEDGDLVAWVDTRQPDVRRLTALAGAGSGARSSVTLPAGAGLDPVGVHAGGVYLAGDTQTSLWRPGEPRVEPVAGSRLLAIGDSTTAWAVPSSGGSPSVGVGRIDGDRLSDPASWVPLPGEEAVLAPDADLALARTRAGDVVLRDLDTGRDLPTGLAPSEIALTVALGERGRIAYVVGRRVERPVSDDEASTFGRPLAVRTCTLAQDRSAVRCDPVGFVDSASAVPLLAP